MSPIAENALHLIPRLSNPDHGGLFVVPPLHQLLSQLLTATSGAPQLVQDELVPPRGNQTSLLQVVRAEKKQSRLEALTAVKVSKQMAHKVFSLKVSLKISLKVPKQMAHMVSLLHLEKMKTSKLGGGDNWGKNVKNDIDQHYMWNTA